MASSRICSIEGCGKNRIARGYCSAHYQRFKYGNGLNVAKPVVEKTIRGADAICVVAGCGKRHNCKGYCKNHYNRFVSHGDPLGGRAAQGEPEKFFREVVLPFEGDDCLAWPYAKIPSGYGQLGKQSVTRLICEERFGPAPSPEYDAAHNCGNGHLGCVNPGHLRWATKKENQADRLLHDTHNRGARNNTAKLTEAEVREIRRLYGSVSGVQLAKRYGLTSAGISNIQKRKSWRWLPD